MRRIFPALALVAAFAGAAQAQTTVSGPITFGTGLSVSGTGAVSIAAAQSGLTCTGCTLGGTTALASGSYMTGELGVGAAPSAVLSVGDPALGGAAASTVFNIDAGVLGTTAGNTLTVASLGFVSSNQESFAVHARRAANGATWATTEIGLTGDVDSVASALGAIWLSPDGVAVASPQSAAFTPAGTLDIENGADTATICLNGACTSAIASATGGVTCSGAPSASFATTNGIVTHC